MGNDNTLHYASDGIKYKQAWEELKKYIMVNEGVNSPMIINELFKLEKERGISTETEQPGKDISKPPVRTFYGIPVK